MTSSEVRVTGPEIDRFTVALEEAARSTGPAANKFIEPAAGTLARALSNRNHLIFGRRGSGKTSLLQKARSEMMMNRCPNAYIDMEKFKGHAYPDVLISVLIETFENIESWLTGGAIAPANKTSFWQRIKPRRGPLKRSVAANLSTDIESYIKELNNLLHAYDDAEIQSLKKEENQQDSASNLDLGLLGKSVNLGTSRSRSARALSLEEAHETARRSKIDALHRRVIAYQKTLRGVVELSGGNGFILLDDMYYLKRTSQPEVLDYFHRLFKGTGLWLKVGTIRHRSSWYKNGDPPLGIKLGDDVEEIDLDLTLEKYKTAKRFLIQVTENVASQSDVDVHDLINEGARDRLVLASGGVARDFLSILRKSVAVAADQGARNVGVASVNQAAGEHESSKRDEFHRDVLDGQRELEEELERIKTFCLATRKKNCFLVEKDLTTDIHERVKELVDLRLIHSINSRVTVRHRPGRIYEAYMLDISQYTGERKRRNVEIIEFWKRTGSEKLRGASLIFAERVS
ncbi:P-loop NTPase fold protein [Streptomyces profundus]|uniref:P-loop NTPase fold protein n=1 Tax=Streptomyces profundus TaxID=2867410 RepID=UPI001D163681|nr:P-loop NTPase fold protein [Streptomyces sp. MA3_2.13]UED85849.1 KAP family NTPase [Streptomyces sp. MA3_2.13]